ncbi:MAG TPA: SAM-dependent methyltransferase, partial [Bacteroidetes bacterium]|nr:SAM-dependent methyltransferase [Bacteroidota bacterium]
MLKHFLRFVRFYFGAKTKYDVHSPFVYEFVREVLEDDRWYYAFDEIENLRAYMLNDQRTIRIKDRGAGSQVEKKKVR